ncbi:MAG: FkbM family methyltransferase [Reyranella sp.]|nr:FkbM family methyltransferase [Reyranella sp.]
MSGLHINYRAHMTAALVSAGAFREQPFTVVDVGARGGVADYWRVFGDDLRIVGFDLDPLECERLAALDPRTIYVPFALDRQAGERRVYVTDHSSGSSFYQPSPAFYARHTADSNVTILSEPMLKTVSLPEAIGAIRPDFIKLDAEGAELEILQGGEALLPGASGILSEVRFSKELSGCPTFWEVEKYLKEQAFELYDLDVYRLSKKALPYPYLYANFFGDGRPAAGPSTQGQVLWADALYLRDLSGENPEVRRLIVMACLFEIFGLNDCAAELILAHREEFDRILPSDRLLDLLVPEVKGQRLTYREYMDRDLVGDPLLRPSEGRRFPEAVIPQYDGEFRPAWMPAPKVPRPSFWQRVAAVFT